VCGKKIGPDPRNFNQRVSLGRNDLLIRTFPSCNRRECAPNITAPACGFWIIKIFQFYFSSNQTARPRQCWRLCGKPKLKKIEKNFSIFQ
ncbi:hypothetical protein L8P88_03740, partial [Enterobacter roggenkampii]|nr:hypothetical protein [Enterobacter roggenkampii]